MRAGATKINFGEIITIEPGKPSAQPCNRSLRILAYDAFHAT